MKLTRVNIGSNKYVNKFEMLDETFVEEITTKEAYDNLSVITPTKTDSVWLSSAIKISFDTPTGELSDGEYATQENGFHWIKILGYAVTKINPEFIKNNILSPAGEIDVEERSVAE